MSEQLVTLDGNEAAAYIAHLTNEVIAIYPITPASPMGEWRDEWSSLGIKNLWGTRPKSSRCKAKPERPARPTAPLQAGALAPTSPPRRACC